MSAGDDDVYVRPGRWMGSVVPPPPAPDPGGEVVEPEDESLAWGRSRWETVAIWCMQHPHQVRLFTDIGTNTPYQVRKNWATKYPGLQISSKNHRFEMQDGKRRRRCDMTIAYYPELEPDDEPTWDELEAWDDDAPGS